MSVTYTDDRMRPYGERLETVESQAHEPFVPRYARTGKSANTGKGKVKTWMILAPIGAIALGGTALALATTPREETALTPALSEPAATAPVLPAEPALTAPIEAAPVAEPAAPAAVRDVAPAPVARSAPVRRSAPAASRAATTPRAEAAAATPAAAPSPSTATLNLAPAVVVPTPTPAPVQPPAPVIVIQPAG